MAKKKAAKKKTKKTAAKKKAKKNITSDKMNSAMPTRKPLRTTGVCALSIAASRTQSRHQRLARLTWRRHEKNALLQPSEAPRTQRLNSFWTLKTRR